jgi:hypothetical protein
MTESNTTARPEDRYWPTVPPDELGAQISSRFLDYHSELDRRGVIDLWRKVSSVYYGYDSGTDSFADWIMEGGEQGEFLHLHVNEFASLVRHQLILTTSEKLEFEAQASNDTPEAEAQASLGEQAIRYYQREAKVEGLLVSACERMLLFGEGIITQLWDAYRGPELGVEEVPELDSEGQPIVDEVEVEQPAAALSMDAPEPPSGLQEEGIEAPEAAAEPAMVKVQQPRMREQIRRGGDFAHRVYGPLDVARDLGCRSREDVRWYIIRERVSRWEAAARYPEHAEYIKDRPAYYCDETAEFDRDKADIKGGRTDQIHQLRLLHDKGEELPSGMEVVVIGDKLMTPVLPLAYVRLPVIAMVPQEVIDTPIAHSMNWNLLGPQSALNAAVSNGLTSSDAGSVPKWAVPRGSNVVIEDLGPNGRVLYYTPQAQAPNAGMPVLLETPQWTNAHASQIEAFRQMLQILSGVNAVVRGESQGKSGADNALIQAQAIQYMSAYVRAFAEAARSWGLGIVEGLQRFADEERMLRVFGDDEAWTVQYFTGGDLAEVHSVDVDLGDPVMRTMQGRKAVASELLERFPNQITPEQYIAFIGTGRLEPLYKAQRNQIRLIRAENEQLSKGKTQPVIKTDCHAEHIREHLALLSSPAIRADEATVTAVLAHVAQHNMLWTMLAATEPSLLAATGQNPPPPPAAPMMGPGGPGGGPPPSGPPGGPPPQNEPPSDAPGSTGGARMPQMPKNAATGERAPEVSPMGGAM